MSNEVAEAQATAASSCSNGPSPSPSPSDPNTADYKELSNGEIKALKKGGIDIHDFKPNARYDLYKDRQGNIYVLPKDNPAGSVPDPTGLNIYNFL